MYTYDKNKHSYCRRYCNQIGYQSHRIGEDITGNINEEYWNDIIPNVVIETKKPCDHYERILFAKPEKYPIIVYFDMKSGRWLVVDSRWNASIM